MKAILGILLGWACVASAGTISLVQDVNMPDPNEEVTVWVHSEDSLFCMGLAVYIAGDATITTAMCEADCNEFGWDNGWNSDPYIDPNGWVYLSGVRWASDANDIVGYFKFRYHSGQVSVTVDQENSSAFCWDGTTITYPTFSTETLLFGQADLMQGGEESLMQESETIGSELLQLDTEIQTEISYLNQTITVAESEYVIYDSNLVLENCTMYINGYVECNSDVNLINSEIIVKGDFKVGAGVTINETGASHITATGDAENEGRIIFDGTPESRIVINSDYVAGNDSEFIIIENASSSDSVLRCIDFAGGWCNIQINNKRLNNAINNCCFYGAKYAIWQDGLDELTDVRFSLCVDNYCSIHIGIDGVYGAEVEFRLDNVVVDNLGINGAYGLALSGLQTTSDFSTLQITNSIITNNFCGWYIGFEMSFYPPAMSNIAYYGNYYNDNLYDSSFQLNPMYLTESPFETVGNWPYFIDPNSPVADVDLGYNLYQDAPEQLLTTLFSESIPRGNTGIGFAIPLSPDTPQHVRYTKSDFDESGRVDFEDFTWLAQDWGTLYDPNTETVLADQDGDGSVDMNDLMSFVGNWLASYSITTVEDANSVRVIFNPIPDLDALNFAVFLDDRYLGCGNTEYNTSLKINKMRYKNGNHNVKMIINAKDGSAYFVSKDLEPFNSPLSEFEFPEIFDPCNIFIVKGKVNPGNIASITLKDTLEQTTVWSENYSNDKFIGVINPSTINGSVNYDITYATASTSSTSSTLGLGGKPSNKIAALGLAMFENSMRPGTVDDAGTVYFMLKSCKNKGVEPIVLRGWEGCSQVTTQNIRRIVAQFPNIAYLCFNTHSSDESDGGNHFPHWDLDVSSYGTNDPGGKVVAWNSRIWTARGVSIPSNYVPLAPWLEKSYNLSDWGLCNLRIATLISCYSQRNPATMDTSFVITPHPDAYEWEADQDPPWNSHPTYPYSDANFGLRMYWQNQIIIGSSGAVVSDDGTLPDYTRFFNDFWNQMCEFNRGVEIAISDPQDGALWRCHIGVRDALRFRGLGFNNTNIVSSSNPAPILPPAN